MKRCLTIAALMIIPIFALSKATEELVKSMVPHGQISQKIGQDFSVKTKAGTKVTIEFDRAGIFEPGNGLLALESVAKALEHKGHHILGEWGLEKDSKQGWVYELAGLKEEETVNYIVNAKSSQLIGIED